MANHIMIITCIKLAAHSHDMKPNIWKTWVYVGWQGYHLFATIAIMFGLYISIKAEPI